MSKIICDVCGSDFPETAEQCPICGCARTDASREPVAQTMTDGNETVAYNYVKGGRFSKSNVRKRLRASQQYVQEQPEENGQEPDEDEDDYDEQDTGSNRGLVIVVILLLLAIIAVSTYIAVNYLGVGKTDPKDTTAGVQTQQTTAPNGDTTAPDEGGIPCTGLTTTDKSIELKTKGSAWLLNVAVEPADTTSKIVYSSSDPNVASVDDDGLVTAVGPGEAVITITCGQFQVDCTVVCNMEADSTTQPSGDVSEPTYDPNETYTVKFNGQTSRWGNDTTINAGSFFNLTLENSKNEAMDVVWTVDNEAICTVNGKTVTGVGNGKATLTTTFAGVEYTCIVRVKGGTTVTEPAATEGNEDNGDATEAPADNGEDQTPEQTTGASGVVRINGLIPTYGNGTNLVDDSEKVGATFTLTVEDEMGARLPVEWTIGNPDICSMEGNKVTCLAAGQTTLTAEYEGVTYKVTLRVSAA